MILEEIIRAVDKMTDEERRLLRRHMDRVSLNSAHLAPRRHSQVLNHLTRASDDAHVLGLCDPVRYEVLRGLFKGNAIQKLHLFQETIAP